MKTLFNKLEFSDDDIFINSLYDIEESLAFDIIETAIRYAHENGIFTLEEATFAFFSLNKIKQLQNND